MKRKAFKEWATKKGGLQANSANAYWCYLNYIEKVLECNLDDIFKEIIDKNKLYTFKDLEDKIKNEMKKEDSKIEHYTFNKLRSALKKYYSFCKENSP